MDFIKKHYEKITLGLVLAGLVGALVFMLFYIGNDREEMRKKSEGVINPPTKPLTNLDLTVASATLTRLGSPYKLDYETGNKVFNPVDWAMDQNKNLIRATKVGPQTCVVTNIAPLYLVITLDSVTTNELGARYAIGVERQAAAAPTKRKKGQRFISVGDKPNDVFSLVEVKGAPESPDAVVLKLVDSGEHATVTKDVPFRRIDGYIADFRYDLEKKVFHNCRVGSDATFGGTAYKVSDVSSNEVGIIDQTNQKRIGLPFNPP